MNLNNATEQELWIGVALIMGVVLFFGLILWLMSERKPKPQLMMCPNCGCSNLPKLVVPGSWLTQIIMLLFFVVPGVMYALIRECATRLECPVCGCCEMIPHDSPRGRKLQAEFQVNKS